MPVRLLKNDFYYRAKEMEEAGAGKEEIARFLGRGRSRMGMFEGDTTNGELEIGQVAGLIKSIKPAAEIMRELMEEYEKAKRVMSDE